MLRLLSLALLVSNIAGCYGFGSDGELCFSSSNCPGPTSDPGLPPSTPPAPLAVMIDGVERANVSVARGGVVEVDVWGRTPALPTMTEDAAAFDLVVTSQTTQAPSRTRIDVVAGDPGRGVLHASVPGFTATLDVEVAEVASIGLSLDGAPAQATMTVMPDLTRARPQVRSAEDLVLLDHSIVIDPESDPEFTDHGTEIGLPATLGEHVLVLTRATGELYPIDVRVVDHLETIVVDELSRARACVHGELGGARVETRAWQFFAAPTISLQPRGNCVELSGAAPGDTLTVERAGTTTQLVIP